MLMWTKYWVHKPQQTKLGSGDLGVCYLAEVVSTGGGDGFIEQVQTDGAR